VQSSPYLSVSAQDFQELEQARQAANQRYVRGFSSYGEAELHGYFSLKRLKQLGLSVPDWMRPYYECAVETKYGRNSQILHLVKAYKEDRYEARAASRSAEPFFNEREEEFFRLVELGQVYDVYFHKAQQECPDYLASKIRRTAQKAAWAELWKRYLGGLSLDQRPKDKRQQLAHRRRLLRKHPIRSVPVQVHELTRDDFKQVLFADVFYGRAVVSTPVTHLFETHHPEIVRWIRKQKAHDYASLARRMQQEESGMMIGAVVRRLMEHHPEVPFYTVHDSITTVEEHGEFVGRVLREEYQRAGLHPTLKQTGDALTSDHTTAR